MRPGAVIVAGPSGCGKTTVGRLLAARLGVPFVDADDHHPPANRAKMTAGIPLDDADRAPWLDALARVLAEGESSGKPPVLACSALRRRYRDRLRAALPMGRLRFVLLAPSRDVLAGRLRARSDHFFPAALLDSQLAALELPGAGETDCLVVADDIPPAAIVDRLSSSPASAARVPGATPPSGPA